MLVRFFIILLVPFAVFALSLQDARHLMDRTSFGLSLQDYQILKNMSKKEAVDWLITQNKIKNPLVLSGWFNAPLLKTKPLKRVK